MGFVLLGLAAANPRALGGAVLQMFSHGVIAGLLFAVVGRMVYDRLHTRRLADLRACELYRSMPFAAATFVIAGVASMGMPGFSGFPAELSILIGAWVREPLWALAGVTGVLVAGAFTMRAIHLSFFGAPRGHSLPVVEAPPPITWPERVGTVLLVAATALVGLHPDLLLGWIMPALDGPLLRAVVTQGGP
jgi:NADH-quinone oxidoreductase subunit M